MCVCVCVCVCVRACVCQVEPKAHRLEEHRRKYERLRSERAERVAVKERQKKKKQAEVSTCEALERQKQRKWMLTEVCFCGTLKDKRQSTEQQEQKSVAVVLWCLCC